MAGVGSRMAADLPGAPFDLGLKGRSAVISSCYGRPFSLYEEGKVTLRMEVISGDFALVSERSKT